MPAVILEQSDGVCLLTMSRPPRRNAFDGAMFAAFGDALAAADADPSVGAIVIAGAGDAFSSGHDRDAFAELWPQPPDGPIARLLMRLPGVATPLLAAVDGAAVGFGATMLLHCDIVLASPRAVLRFPFIELGIVPEAGSTALLPLQIGDRAALDLILTGRPVAAAEACALGLVTRVVGQEEDVRAVTLAAAKAIAARPRDAVRETLRLLKAGRRAAAENATRREIEVLNRLAPGVVARLRR
jgi:enoyl-CoA hydratase/carnithine racemase